MPGKQRSNFLNGTKIIKYVMWLTLCARMQKKGFPDLVFLEERKEVKLTFSNHRYGATIIWLGRDAAGTNGQNNAV